MSNNNSTQGMPSLPNVNFQLPSNTAVSPTNIFDLIKQSTSQSMSSVLPYVQAQYNSQSANVAPQAAEIARRGEENAASAQSNAQARGMRGSDIEAAGMANARAESSNQIAQLYSQLAMQQAQQMAQSIMTAYGYDVEANKEMFINLAQAIGQELSQQRELSMFNEQMALAKKAIDQQRKSATLGTWVGAISNLGSAALSNGMK